jgi:hypothetical protein
MPVSCDGNFASVFELKTHGDSFRLDQSRIHRLKAAVKMLMLGGLEPASAERATAWVVRVKLELMKLCGCHADRPRGR